MLILHYILLSQTPSSTKAEPSALNDPLIDGDENLAAIAKRFEEKYVS